ncbi:hypothetical protein AB0M44_30730 [Streptosporangium subroseum]|uniref:hypothetical protein n=1 Tax=Streptosporangium subroseum TaxID=106412 RepID=UPI0034294C10
MSPIRPVTPSRSAATEPSTTAGYRPVAALSHVPERISPSSVASSSPSAARTAMPPVMFSEIMPVRPPTSAGAPPHPARARIGNTPTSSAVRRKVM